MATLPSVPMFDPSGVLRDIPANKVDDALASGAERAVSMNDPWGTHRYIPESRAAQAQASGAIPTSDMGTVAGIKRALSGIIHYPSAIYDAFTQPPQNDEEEAAYNIGAHIPGLGDGGVIALAGKRLLFDPQAQQMAKAEQYKKMPPSPEQSALDNAQERAHMHAIAAFVPIAGPLAANAADRWLAGDKAGAISELLTYAAATKGSEEAIGKLPSAPEIGASVKEWAQANPKTAQSFAQSTGLAAGAGLGGTIGHATGLPYAGTAGAFLGGQIGKVWGKALGEKLTEVPEAAAPESTPPAPAPGAPQPPVEAKPAPTISDDTIARSLGYKDAAQARQRLGDPVFESVADKVRTAPTREGVGRQAVSAAPQNLPAAESTVWGQYNEQTGKWEPASAPSSVELDLATKAAPPLPRDLSDAFDDSAVLEKFRQDMQHEGHSINLAEKEQPRYMGELPSGGATKGMETTAASAGIKGEEPPEWTQLPNWTEADTQRVLGGDYRDPKAVDGSKNVYARQSQYEAAKNRWEQKVVQPSRPAPVASMKAMITNADRAAMYDLGYTRAQVDKLRPAEVGEILTRKQRPSDLTEQLRRSLEETPPQ